MLRNVVSVFAMSVLGAAGLRWGVAIDGHVHGMRMHDVAAEPSRDGGLGAAPGSPRRIRRTTWSRLWRVTTGRSQDIVSPGKAIALGGLLYVTDISARRVIALDVRDGKMRWKIGDDPIAGDRMGVPTDIVSMPNGDIAIADPVNRRIVVVNAAGRLRRVIAAAPVLHSICVLGDESILVVDLNPSAPVARFDREGNLVSSAVSPWKQFISPGQVQGILQRVPGEDRCIYALQTENGFSTVAATGFGPSHSYAEADDSVHGRTAAVSLLTTPKTVAILFRGGTSDKFRLIDLYDGKTFAYRESVVLPTEARWLARYQGTLFAIEKKNDEYAISALTLDQGLSSILP